MEPSTIIANIGYLISIACFILGIKRLGKVKTARSANMLSASAMAIAVISQLVELGAIDYQFIIAGVLLGSLIGAIFAIKVQMTAMPQLVAIFNGFGGLASTLVGLSLFTSAWFALTGSESAALGGLAIQGTAGLSTAITLILSIVIGSITFTGSIMAFLKLSDTFGRQFGNPILLPARHVLNALIAIGVVASSYYWIASAADPSMSINMAIAITVLTLLLGFLLVIPIGGADMPVVISLLNSYSGLAAAAAGFALGSNVLIVSGSLVGASGLILTSIMCKAMNRSLANVMFGGFGGDAAVSSGDKDQGYANVKSSDPEEAAMDFDGIQSVVIVPGYGLAVAQGQNAVKEFADQLKAKGVQVRYAIHPVAGRMPGHMNVLLAESSVPYDELYEMDAINNDFQATDIAVVVGANDVVNPAAKDDESSPLYGMPVLNVDESRMVFVIKRSLSPGFAGVKNELFERDNTRMIYGDAKKVLEEMTSHLNED